MLRTCIDTANVGDTRWRPPQMEEGWNASCQAILKGTEWGRVGEVVPQVRGNAHSGQP